MSTTTIPRKGPTAMTLTAAHQLLTEIARTITTSPLANPKHMESVHINSRIALLTNALAGRHLALLDTAAATASQQEQLLEISDPHMQAMTDDLWQQTTEREPDDNCLTSLATSGQIAHNCAYDDKPLPCLTCPMLTRQMPNIAQGIRRCADRTPPPAHKPHFGRAAAAALRVMDLSEQWAQTMLGCQRTESRAVAAAETVYYTSAAIERHPRFGPSGSAGPRGNEGPWITRSEQVFDRLYQVMGGPPGRTAARPPTPDYGCLLFIWARDQSEYHCQDPEKAGPNGDRPEPCEDCPLGQQSRKPMPWQLLAAAVSREIYPSFSGT